MKVIKKYSLILLCFLLIAATFLYYGRAKAGFFIDEIHTYGLSNSHYAPYITDAAGGTLIDTTITRDQLIDFATVNDGEILDFGSVYYNQSQDVHPPLYYWLFNIASSITGENFTKWTGLCLDFVLYIISLIILYKISEKLFSNKIISCCILVLYGISTIGISTAIYIRMYVLSLLITMSLVFFAVKLLQSRCWKYAFGILGSIVLGVLTQYYFIFYAFFLIIALDIHFLIQHDKKLFWRTSFSGLTGVIIPFCIFPSGIKQIFVGNGKVVGGSSILDSVLNFSTYPERISSYVHFLTYGLKAAIIVSIIALAIVLLTKRLYEKCFLYTFIIVAPAIISWITVIMICPENAVEERYIYNIAPVFVILTGWLISSLQEKYIKWSLPISTAIAIICVIMCKPQYLFSQSLDYNEKLSSHSDDACIFMTDNHFEPLTFDFQQLLIFDDIFTTDNPSSEKMIDYISSHNSDEIIVFIDQDEFWSSGYNPDEMLPKIEEATGYNLVEQLYFSGFNGVYLLSEG